MECWKIVEALDTLSPRQYACDWDNVGLLVGRNKQEVKRVMVTLDATKEVISQAVEEKVDMLVTHHPMIFSSLKQINEDGIASEKILTLIENGIACYAMHTNFDAVGGMANLAAGEDYLNLSQTSPVELCKDSNEGMGRYGLLPRPMTGREVAEYVKERFGLPFVLLYQSESEKNRVFDRIAVMPGSGKSEMMSVKRQGYDLYLTGDYGHHEGIDAMDMGMTIIDATHYGLEHIFIDYVASFLKNEFGNCLTVLTAKQKMPVMVI